MSVLIAGCVSVSDETTISGDEYKKSNLLETTYQLGRFSINIPEDMKQAVLTNKVFYTDINTFVWDNRIKHGTERKNIWDDRLVSIKGLTRPDDVKDIVIDQMDFSTDRHWAKGVFYYDNSVSKIYAGWDVLVDSGEYGIWLKVSGAYDKRSTMIKVLKIVINSYRTTTNQIDNIKNGLNYGYYLNHGMLDFDFKEQERTYSRFEGNPLDQYLKVKIEMNVVDEIEETNLIQRLSIAVAGNFAPGISIDEIRSEQREVAGLKGEEVIIRGTEEDDSNLIFSWRFPGEKDSATAPEILIKMDAKDGDLDAKLVLWDAILNSFKPLGQ